MHPQREVFNPEGLVGILKWLQLKTRVSCFDNLHMVVVTTHGDEDCVSAWHQHQQLQPFSQSVAAALAGAWHLRRFMMVLHSPLAMDAPMLPPMLWHLGLELHADTPPGTVALSMFEGLKELRTTQKVKAVTAKRQKTACFKVDAQFSAITSLEVVTLGHKHTHASGEGTVRTACQSCRII